MTLKEFIVSLKRSRNLKFICPCCEKATRASQATLFTEKDLTEGALEYKARRDEEIAELVAELKELKKGKPERSRRGAEASNLGKIMEKFAPILPGFSAKAEECATLFDPIDYIAFHGMTKGKVSSLTFMDVKTGRGSLGQKQRSIRETVERGCVALEVIRRST